MKKTNKILQTLVLDAYPDAPLGRICLADVDSFFSESKEKKGWFIHRDKYDSKYWSHHYAFKDNNASILAVAHCDTVFDGKYPYKFDSEEMKVYSPELDDRLGVYIITSLLSRLGVNCDILLTDNEESCASTAKQFTTEKKYNWIMEWDRRGAGCVMYQYETKEMVEVLDKYGLKVSTGTYSDIADLYKLGVVGINFATGYSQEHTKDCFVDLRCLSRQLSKFVKFYNDYKDTKLESKAGPRYSYRYVWRDSYVPTGYLDIDGVWHYYGASSAGTPTSNNYGYPTCVSCKRVAYIKTSYRVRGQYICPNCEEYCLCCKRAYAKDQMANKQVCIRCKAVLDAMSSKVTCKCNLCDKETTCTEYTPDFRICATCLAWFFVVCDKCKGLNPYHKLDNIKHIYPAGLCKGCFDKTAAEYKRNYRRKNRKLPCTGCQKKFPFKELKYSTQDKKFYCEDCHKKTPDNTMPCDECGESFPVEELDYYDESGLLLCKTCQDKKDLDPYEEIGYGECDVCKLHDALYFVDELCLCKTCRDQMTARGV